MVVAASVSGNEAVGGAAGRAIEQLVLVDAQARIDVDHALDAAHARVSGQAARVVVQRGHVLRVGDRAVRPDGQQERRELALAELVDEQVVRLRATGRRAAGSRRPAR